MSLTVCQRIAIAYSTVLRETLTETVIRKVNEENRTTSDEAICSSTKYCDSYGLLEQAVIQEVPGMTRANASESDEWFIAQHYARQYGFDPEAISQKRDWEVDVASFQEQVAMWERCLVLAEASKGRDLVEFLQHQIKHLKQVHRNER